MAKKSTTPAKKRAKGASATGNDSREKILSRVAKVGQLLDSYMQKLRSSDPNNGKLRIANGCWGIYPMWKEIVDSDLRQTSDEVVRSLRFRRQPSGFSNGL